MPVVKSKKGKKTREFSYDPAGMAQAELFAKKTGGKLTKASKGKMKSARGY